MKENNMRMKHKYTYIYIYISWRIFAQTYTRSFIWNEGNGMWLHVYPAHNHNRQKSLRFK